MGTKTEQYGKPLTCLGWVEDSSVELYFSPSEEWLLAIVEGMGGALLRCFEASTGREVFRTQVEEGFVGAWWASDDAYWLLVFDRLNKKLTANRVAVPDGGVEHSFELSVYAPFPLHVVSVSSSREKVVLQSKKENDVLFHLPFFVLVDVQQEQVLWTFDDDAWRKYFNRASDRMRCGPFHPDGHSVVLCGRGAVVSVALDGTFRGALMYSGNIQASAWIDADQLLVLVDYGTTVSSWALEVLEVFRGKTIARFTLQKQDERELFAVAYAYERPQGGEWLLVMPGKNALMVWTFLLQAGAKLRVLPRRLGKNLGVCWFSKEEILQTQVRKGDVLVCTRVSLDGELGVSAAFPLVKESVPIPELSPRGKYLCIRELLPTKKREIRVSWCGLDALQKAL